MSRGLPLDNPYEKYIKGLVIGGKELSYYDIRSLDSSKYDCLPYCIRVLLESAVRNCDLFQIKPEDVENILNWEVNQNLEVDIPFRPSRVILQDFTGVPAIVDFAAMRDAVKKMGGDPQKVNPVVPVDLVIDHSVQVDVFGSDDAVEKNQQLEFERNEERFRFLKWGAKAFSNMQIIPPGSGIVHQVNLEYLARVVFNQDGVVYPDSIVGTDSHTTMINGLGVIGWGVGGIEAEAVMLGQAISMILPKVVGYKLTGSIGSMVTSTDVVLTITKNLRNLGVVGKFVEFFGPGVAQLSIADRATISNMCPEYGATIGFFAVDDMSLKYLKQTGRSEEHISLIKSYLTTIGLFRDYNNFEEDPLFSERIELNLSSVVPSLSGPKRPHDRVPVCDMKKDFSLCLSNKVGFKGYGLNKAQLNESSVFQYKGQQFSIKHGSVLISAITSCTNTSNPSVMLGAGLLAKKAVEKGLTVPPYIKTSLSPGSGVVTYYLKESGVIQYLNQLGFNVVGYGCMTCIGNSGPLPDEVVAAVEEKDVVAVGILSGNRNFEGRVNPYTRANYLASPPLCIAYAIAGTVLINFEEEPMGFDHEGAPVYLQDIWPSRQEIQEVERCHVLPVMFEETYSKVTEGNKSWNNIQYSDSTLFPWDISSTYIRNPPFFKNLSKEIKETEPIQNAFTLLVLGDFVTTDHISPAGSISRNSSAARYLSSMGLTPRQFNSYGSRRGNDEVMARGTFANIRLLNQLVGKPGPKTIHIPSGDTMDIFDAAMRYMEDGHPLILFAGKNYGSGSSRDWAAKGPWIMGIKAVIAESFERIHRSNLIGMGILPLQYLNSKDITYLKQVKMETFTLEIPVLIKPRQVLQLQVSDGSVLSVLCCIHTEVEAAYYQHGGILNYMIRMLCP